MDNTYYHKYLLNKNSKSSYQNDIYKSKYYKYKNKYLLLKNNILKGGASKRQFIMEDDSNDSNDGIIPSHSLNNIDDRIIERFNNIEEQVKNIDDKVNMVTNKLAELERLISSD